MTWKEHQRIPTAFVTIYILMFIDQVHSLSMSPNRKSTAQQLPKYFVDLYNLKSCILYEYTCFTCPSQLHTSLKIIYICTQEFQGHEEEVASGNAKDSFMHLTNQMILTPIFPEDCHEHV